MTKNFISFEAKLDQFKDKLQAEVEGFSMMTGWEVTEINIKAQLGTSKYKITFDGYLSDSIDDRFPPIPDPRQVKPL